MTEECPGHIPGQVSRDGKIRCVRCGKILGKDWW